MSDTKPKTMPGVSVSYAGSGQSITSNAMGMRAMQQLLDRCDLLVAILWSRLGTPTNSDLSGTVQEIREFSEKKGPERVLIFFCDRALPNSADLPQVQAVRDFKDSIKGNGLYALTRTFGEDAWRQGFEIEGSCFVGAM
ncbi:MAG: hypothetical protein ACKN85_03720 [Pirellula sp.]|jgi:hypothetical protein